MLYAVTFPDYCDNEHAQRIDAWRSRFSAPYADAVRGHFTLVFGTDVLSSDGFEQQVRSVAAETSPFSVTLGVPLIWPEDSAYLLFLVPEQGLSDCCDAHDRLYVGPLAASLRTDLPYVPHMTIGRFDTFQAAAEARDEVRGHLPIMGNISTLDILDTSNGIEQVATVQLGDRA